MSPPDEDATPASESATVYPPPVEGTEVRAKPTRMAPVERQIGWLIVAVALGALLASHFSGATSARTTVGSTAAGVGLVIIMAGTIWYGQRIFAAFASLLAGFAPLSKNLIYLSFFSLGYGAFLMFKASRAQSKAAATRPRRPPRQRGTKAGAADSRSTGRGRGRTGAGSAGSGPGGRRPSANRRYTPPASKNTRRGR
jgi:hypothetical protein